MIAQVQNGQLVTCTASAQNLVSAGLIPSLSSPPPIGNVTPNTGAFTTLSGNVSAATVLATGSTTARTLAAIAALAVGAQPAIPVNAGKVLTAPSAVGGALGTLPVGGADGVVVADGSGNISAQTVLVPSAQVAQPLGAITNQTDTPSQNTSGNNSSLSATWENILAIIAAIPPTGLTENTLGVGNTAFGFEALIVNQGSFNTAFGRASMQANTTGIFNTAYGTGSLVNNTSGQRNTAIGADAMQLCTTGEFNTAVGVDALELLTNGNSNIAMGFDAGENITTGSFNVALGQGAFSTATTSKFCTVVGRLAGVTAVTSNGIVAIGTGADLSIADTGQFSNLIVIGLNNKLGINNAWCIGTVGTMQAIYETAGSAVAGVATLVNGTATITSTAVNSNIRVQMSRQTASGTLGHLSVGSIGAGTFTIISSSSTDNSTVYWEMKEPAA